MGELPRLLVVGHVTRDELADGGVRLGGAASYGGLAAARLGVPAGIVTAAPSGEALLEPLRDAANLTLHVAASEVMTTFALGYAGTERTLVLKARARTLAPGDVPAPWQGAPVAFVGPVAAECDRGFIAALRCRFVGVGLQGWLRRADDDGRIVAAQLPEVLEPPPVSAAVLSELDHPDAPAVAERFARAGAVVALTRGARGATILWRNGRADVHAEPAFEVDPTGAGDVFGVVFTLGLAAGDAPVVAARAAARAAARVVEGPGLGRL